MKKVRILALVHEHLVPPEDTTGIDILEAEWKMEYDVIETLREMGHTVHVLGINDDLSGIRPTAEEFKPHIVFNLMEAFAGVTTFDQNVVSYLELLRMPYTGCNPRGLILARDKALSKKLLAYHRIRVPEFFVVRPGRKPVLPKRLTFPMIVKSLFFEASAGISQASVVENHEQLARRVSFIHEKLGTAAIVEQFIDGRELYIGVVGNERLDVFPAWEMSFDISKKDTKLILGSFDAVPRGSVERFVILSADVENDANAKLAAGFIPLAYHAGTRGQRERHRQYENQGNTFHEMFIPS